MVCVCVCRRSINTSTTMISGNSRCVLRNTFYTTLYQIHKQIQNESQTIWQNEYTKQWQQYTKRINSKIVNNSELYLRYTNQTGCDKRPQSRILSVDHIRKGKTCHCASSFPLLFWVNFYSFYFAVNFLQRICSLVVYRDLVNLIVFFVLKKLIQLAFDCWHIFRYWTPFAGFSFCRCEPRQNWICFIRNVRRQIKNPKNALHLLLFAIVYFHSGHLNSCFLV